MEGAQTGRGGERFTSLLTGARHHAAATPLPSAAEAGQRWGGEGVSAHLSDFLVALCRKQLMLTASIPTFAFFDLEGTSLLNSVEQKRFQALPWLRRPGRTTQRLLSLPASRGCCSQLRVLMKIAASAVYQLLSFINDFPPKTWKLLDPTGRSSHHPAIVGVPPGSKVERVHR